MLRYVIAIWLTIIETLVGLASLLQSYKTVLTKRLFLMKIY
jgi:hypothetical protein